ncbi:MAG: RNA polymerase sigma factor [Flavobacteriia bacterium]|nr:RNA polymerase sigma factor [Flavobacteriia bacterium]NBP28012.1 RNA polymerase sigma factor [Flavobacteriia bacterium]
MKLQVLEQNVYTTIVRENQPGLLRYALNFLGSADDARDVVQDVFEKLWIHAERIEVEKAKSWLYTCAHNTMLNFIKRRNRLSYMQSVQLDSGSSVDRFTFESNEIIEKTVSMLPPLQKSILLLRDLEGYSYEEIGALLELNPSQVKVYLFRARMKVKNQLKTVHYFA